MLRCKGAALKNFYLSDLIGDWSFSYDRLGCSVRVRKCNQGMRLAMADGILGSVEMIKLLIYYG